MPLSRRRLLHHSLSLASALPLLRSRTLFAASTDDDRAARIARIIEAYSRQGIHRTGTPEDEASARWLGEQIEALNVPFSLDILNLQRVNVLASSFEFDGLSLDAVPLYDCRFTDSVGVSGNLGALGSEAEIGVIMLPPSTASARHTQLDDARRANRHTAIVIVSDASYPPDGVAVINAEDFSAPVGPPTVQIANVHWDGLQSAMAAGRTARVVSHCEHLPATAFNVSAKIAGTDPALAPLVVMTPRSAWWRSASERGGGIAVFLELMRDLVANPPARDVLFTANTGHELGHLGLDQYLHDNPLLLKEAAAWIHLGANFAARNSQIRLQYSDQRIKDLAAGHLLDMALQPGVETPLDTRPLGEARNVHDGGGRFLSILGNNALFHHPHDQWPHAVDVETTAVWSAALEPMVRELSR